MIDAQTDFHVFVLVTFLGKIFFLFIFIVR